MAVAARQPWELRLMQEGDLEQVLDLERICFSDPWRRESFIAEIRGAPRVRWPLVAVSAADLGGYVIAWFVADEAQVANLAVAPGERRRGLGSQLLSAVLEEAGRRGCVSVHLEVRPSNAAARSLYDAYGFRPVGRRRHYYADTGEDALVMRLDLGAEARHDE
ncbi:MAG: ribosomal protein S18-alanine N-acetyltransferase [Candidatus Eisenbacteria bacterium]